MDLGSPRLRSFGARALAPGARYTPEPRRRRLRVELSHRREAFPPQRPMLWRRTASRQRRGDPNEAEL